jgi:hypothetical protein
VNKSERRHKSMSLLEARIDIAYSPHNMGSQEGFVDLPQESSTPMIFEKSVKKREWHKSMFRSEAGIDTALFLMSRSRMTG